VKAAMRLLRCRAGTTAIETAVLLPTFLLMFLGIVEFGRAMWMESTLQDVVEAAARCAVVNTSTCDTAADTASYAASQVTGFSVSSSAFTATMSTTCGTGVAGSSVSVSLPFAFVVPKLLPWSITLSAQSCHPS
jgi:Flp pilus assembly protein TadG